MIGYSVPIIIKTELTWNPLTVGKRDLNVAINFVDCTVSDIDVVMPTWEDLDYQIGDSAVEVFLKQFESSQVDFCNYDWTYALS